MPAHEQGVIDAFNQYVRKRALAQGRSYHSFSLDGQDRDAGADYLLCDGTRFALVEFKDEIADIRSEAKKPRRMHLCIELEREADMREYHDKAHFLCWKEKLSGLKLNIYRLEVCNKRLATDVVAAALVAEAPDVSRRIAAHNFADQFLSGSTDRSLSIDEFERYLQWLLQGPSAGSTASLELLALNPDLDECAVLMFPSIRAAHTWLQDLPQLPEAIAPEA